MSIASEVWEKVLIELRSRVSPAAMSSWFEDCSAYDLTDSELILYTPKKFKAEIIEKLWKDEVMQVVRDLLPGIITLRVLSN